MSALIKSSKQIPICIVSGDPELISWLTEQFDNLGFNDVQATTFFHLPLMKRTVKNIVYLLDVTSDTTIDATHKVEAVLELCDGGALVVVGDKQQGASVANWIRKGVVDYLDWKPTAEDLERSLEIANLRVSTLSSLRYEYMVLSERRHSITESEEMVLEMVMQGVPNKAIAARLSVSQRTVEARRQKIYQKMRASKLADLIKAIERLERIGTELTHASPTDRLASLARMRSLPKPAHQTAALTQQ